jgi:hypothetical protein
VLQQAAGMTDEAYAIVHPLIVKDVCQHFHTQLSDGKSVSLEEDSLGEYEGNFIGMRNLFNAIQRRAMGNTMLAASEDSIKRLRVEMKRLTWPSNKMPDVFPPWCIAFS